MKWFCLFFFCLSGIAFTQELTWVAAADSLKSISSITSSKKLHFVSGLDDQGKSRLLTFKHDGQSAGNIPLPFHITKIICSGDGPVYFTGFFSDSFSNNGINYTADGSADGICGALAENGQLLWLKQFGGSGIDRSNDICFSGDGRELLVTAEVAGGIKLQQEMLLGASGGQSIWLGRFDLNGKLLQFKYLNYESGTAGKNAGLEIRSQGDAIYLLSDRKGKAWNESINQNEQSGIYLSRHRQDFTEQWSQFIINNGCYYGFECGAMSVREKDVLVPDYCSAKYGGTGHLKVFESATGAQQAMVVNENGFYKSCAEAETYYFIGTEEAIICPCEGNDPGVQVIRRQVGNGPMEYLMREKNCRLLDVYKSNSGLLVAGYTAATVVAGKEIRPGFFLMALRDAASSVLRNNNEIPVRIYPNPNSGYLQLEVPVGSSRVMLTIFDLSGRLVLEKQLQVEENRLVRVDITLLEEGSYLLVVDVDEKMQHHHIILRK